MLEEGDGQYAPVLAGRVEANREACRRIVTVLLSEAAPERLEVAAARLYDMLARLGGVGGGSSAPDGLSILLAMGEAISPENAGRCVLDCVRTAKFLRGVHEALAEAERRFPDGVIQVLYAGCGPYAALLLPLIPWLAGGRFQFTLLDVHRRSLDSARRLFQYFDAESLLSACVEADATSYISPQPVHVVLSETMQRALSREPQVAITRHLASQLVPEGLLVPERIVVEAVWGDPGRGVAIPHALPLGRIFELTANRARLAMEMGEWPEVVIDLPAPPVGGWMPMLATRIEVFGAERLLGNESGLTCPALLPVTGRGRAAFRYVEGPSPGFMCEWRADDGTVRRFRVV